MDTVTAVVEKLVLDGKHGPYAVATAKGLGIVTFSLEQSVWQEQSHPESGTLVILSDLRLKRAGWRAHTGRFVRPSDQQSVPSTEQGDLE